jgi:hypothetical protein
MIRFSPMYFDLLANATRLNSMGDRFRKGSKSFDAGDVVLWVAVLAVIGLAFWMLAQYRERQDGPDRTNSPRRLFFELCRAHELKFADRWLLWRVARWQRLTQPAKLFVEPERFDAANLSRKLLAKNDQLVQLRDKLFAAEA